MLCVSIQASLFAQISTQQFPVNNFLATNFKTTLYKTKDGLSANATKALAQDANSVLWIGLDEGLSRFDGTRFRNFRNSLPSRYVKYLYQTRNKRILVAHDLGISEIHETPDTVTFPLLLRGERTETDTAVNYPKQVFEQDDGTLWIAESKSVVRFRAQPGREHSPSTLKRFAFPARCQTNSFLRSFSFVPDGFGSFVVCSQTGYCFWYDRTNDSFKEISLPNGTPLAAASDMLNMGQGVVWIAYADGIAELRFDKQGNFLALSRRLSQPSASLLHRTAQGSIFLGTWFSGLYLLEQHQASASKKSSADSNSLIPRPCPLPFNSVNMLLSNENGEIWVSSDEGIALLKPSPVLTIEFGGKSRGYIQAITRDPRNTIFTSDGMAAYRLHSRTNGTSASDNDKQARADKTNCDDAKLPKNSHTVVPEEIFRIKGTDILAMAHTTTALWCGTTDGKLYRADARDVAQAEHTRTEHVRTEHVRFEQIPTITHDGRSPTLFYLFADAQQTVWACGELDAGALRVRDHNTQSSSQSSSQSNSQPNAKPNVELYDAARGLPSVIRCFAESPDRVLYAAGRSRNRAQYLFRYSASTDRFTDISKPLPTEATTDFEVNDLCVRGADDIWLCSSVGLFHLTAHGVVKVPIIYAPTGEEIINIKAIQRDDNGVLWIGTSHGVVVYHASGEYFFLNENGGLPANEIAFRAMLWAGKYSGMWIGTAKGMVNVASLASTPPATPTPLLTFLRVNGQREKLSELVRTSHVVQRSNNNGSNQSEMNEVAFPHAADIQLGFLSVVFGEDAVTYQYRLLGEGRDSSWSPPQQEAGTTFLTLPTGAYRLQVRAIQSGAYRWSAAMTFRFRVAPAWYEHWWSQVGLVVLAGGIIWGAARMYGRRLEHQKQMLQGIVEERTREIYNKNVEITLSRERLETMSEIGRNLTASLSFEVIANALYDSVSTILPVEQFSLGLLNPERASIHYRFVMEQGARLDGEETHLDHADPCAVWVITRRTPVFINNPATDAPRYAVQQVAQQVVQQTVQQTVQHATPHAANEAAQASSPQTASTQTASIEASPSQTSSIYTPLMLEEQAFGVLSVKAFRLNAYTPEHLDILQSLSDYAAIAIANAESNEKILHQQALLEQQAQELHEQNTQLLDLNTEKNEFLGIVAHDLKNPISTIRGLTDIMLDSSFAIDADEQLRLLNIISTSTERMLKLVTNLLDINRFERGATSFALVRLNLAPLISAILQNYREQAAAKNITLHREILTATSVYADEEAMVQILDNLISNAVKYSPQGKNVFVEIKEQGTRNKEQDVSPAPCCLILVRDEGPGISAEDMKKLFGKFARLSARPTGGEHSTGLGLSIVKKMVEAMNGRVWCESELGKGATFIVELPVAEPASRPLNDVAEQVLK
jgi:signal transduction histidine kinase/ligand-binding sensor domain-containing protein